MRDINVFDSEIQDATGKSRTSAASAMILNGFQTVDCIGRQTLKRLLAFIMWNTCGQTLTN